MPRGLSYDEEQVMQGTAMKISEEAVRWSQRNMKKTDWSRAWDKFDQFESTKQIKHLGLDSKQISLGSDEDEETIEFCHLHPATVSMK